jgi:hypothetical protein
MVILNVRSMIIMVNVPLRKEWVVVDLMLINLTSSHSSLDPLLEVSYLYSCVTVFFMLCFIINVTTGFYMFLSGGSSRWKIFTMASRRSSLFRAMSIAPNARG